MSEWRVIGIQCIWCDSGIRFDSQLSTLVFRALSHSTCCAYVEREMGGERMGERGHCEWYSNWKSENHHVQNERNQYFISTYHLKREKSKGDEEKTGSKSQSVGELSSLLCKRMYSNRTVAQTHQFSIGSLHCFESMLHTQRVKK